MAQEIASAINSVNFPQKAPANMQILITQRNFKGAILAITQQNAIVVMALANLKVIQMTTWTIE